MRRLLGVAALSILLCACDGSTDYVDLTFEIVVPAGFDWSRVSTLAIEIDDGSDTPVRSESTVVDGAFELAVAPTDPDATVIARVRLLDAAGGEVAAGATPPFVPVLLTTTALRIFAVQRAALTPLPEISPEMHHEGAATALLDQWVFLVSDAGDDPIASIYDGLTHATIPGVSQPLAPIVSPRVAAITPRSMLVLDDVDHPHIYYVGDGIDGWTAPIGLDAPHDAGTPGACVAALPEGGAIIVGGRDDDGAASPAVTIVGEDGVADTRDPLPSGRDGCRLVAFGSAVLVLPLVREGEPYPDDVPALLYDVSTGESVELADAGAEVTSAARLVDGALLLVRRDGGLVRLAARTSGDLDVAPSDYTPLGQLDPIRIAPEVLAVGSLGVLVMGGIDEEGVALDGGQSFEVDVSSPGSLLEAVPRRGSAIASLPDVGALVVGGPDHPDRVMILRP